MYEAKERWLGRLTFILLVVATVIGYSTAKADEPYWISEPDCVDRIQETLVCCLTPENGDQYVVADIDGTITQMPLNDEQVTKVCGGKPEEAKGLRQAMLNTTRLARLEDDFIAAKKFIKRKLHADFELPTIRIVKPEELFTEKESLNLQRWSIYNYNDNVLLISELLLAEDTHRRRSKIIHEFTHVYDKENGYDFSTKVKRNIAEKRAYAMQREYALEHGGLMY